MYITGSYVWQVSQYATDTGGDACANVYTTVVYKLFSSFKLYFSRHITD